MDALALIVALAVSGLIVGAVARLLLPGPDPMGIGATILIGIGGSLLGGWIGRALFGPGYVPGLLIAIGGAILLLLLVRSSRARGHHVSPRSIVTIVRGYSGK